MSGPTNQALKRAFEEIRDELTGNGSALVWPLGCDIIANSPVVLTMLANKLAQPTGRQDYKFAIGQYVAIIGKHHKHYGHNGRIRFLGNSGVRYALELTTGPNRGMSTDVDEADIAAE